MTLFNGNRSARFTINGVNSEGELNIRLAAGTITDAVGNPNLDFNASYASDLDFGTLSAGISGTYSLENSTAGNAAGPFVSIQSVGVPLYAVSGFAQLITGPWNLRASVQFTP